ncbi:sugar kinase [Fulvivirga lutimaris]|uniref:sugar kinase n=1 Tax=Fulvivirga lutimaris TaxID=1819566 RepID=UPI0012BC7AF2|nr:sugar kinase [Fulvivirga lutimaris]MTI39193.1 sugar kinase [Fulvivirga lutimaris]
MKRIVTFGEVMMRLTTPGHQRFTQAKGFEATFGGGEANVSMSLAQFGLEAAHITRFPDNELGQAAIQFLKTNNVSTDHIVKGGDRLGLYFLETGSSVRPGKIIYDRANSAFAGVEPEMIDWEKVLDGASWFHWTGISPAISAGAAACCKAALEVAYAKGITVSGDVNYRKNLWQYGKSAQEVMPDLIAKSDVLVTGVRDAAEILNIYPEAGADNEEISVYNKIIERFPNVKKIVNTTRNSISATHNKLSGNLYDGKQFLKTREYEINPIVDRIGGGDAFLAGLIYGMHELEGDQEALDFGVAAAVLKHTIEGDVNLARVEEVQDILAGDTSGRIKR